MYVIDKSLSELHLFMEYLLVSTRQISYGPFTFPAAVDFSHSAPHHSVTRSLVTRACLFSLQRKEFPMTRTIRTLLGAGLIALSVGAASQAVAANLVTNG